MKVVQFDDVTPVRGLEHRGGTFHSRTTAAGEPGTPGNFKFSVSELGTDYSGPRHRHNFDQYRFMLSGESDYGQDGPLKAGMLGYYPEGVPYGPQVNNTPIVCAVLQFGGASGSGYLQPREVKAGMEELKKGIYMELDLMRVYTKKRGEDADLHEPLVIRRGTSVGMVCEKLHRDLKKEFRFALVWGKSVKHQPQRVGLAHVLTDGDIIQIIKRQG
jgi:hypothetical protein